MKFYALILPSFLFDQTRGLVSLSLPVNRRYLLDQPLLSYT